MEFHENNLAEQFQKFIFDSEYLIGLLCTKINRVIVKSSKLENDWVF